MPTTWSWHFPVTSAVKEPSLILFPSFSAAYASGCLGPAYLLLEGSGDKKTKPLPFSPWFRFDHLRVIKRPLQPRAERTGSKIIFSWNILLNWNALAVKKHCSHLNKSIWFFFFFFFWNLDYVHLLAWEDLIVWLKLAMMRAWYHHGVQGKRQLKVKRYHDWSVIYFGKQVICNE